MSELYSLMPSWGFFNRIRVKGWKVWPRQQKQKEKEEEGHETGVLYARHHVSLHPSYDWKAFPNTCLLGSVQMELKGAHTHWGSACGKGSNRGNNLLKVLKKEPHRETLPICPTAESVSMLTQTRVPWEQLCKYAQGRQTPAANPAAL